MKIKFLWNGIKIDGKLYRCFYSDGKLINHPEGTLTIYAKDYKHIPNIPELQVQNDSDSMTDYFETDRIRITPDNPYHEAVLEALKKYNEHHDNKKSVQRNRAITAQRAMRFKGVTK
jgi:hypothetical protein